MSGANARDQFTNREAFDAWAITHGARIADLPDAKTLINTSNPAVIPRNHRIEQMIASARDGVSGCGCC